MNNQLVITMEAVIEALRSKNIKELMSYFGDEAVMIDPHFPIANMTGKSFISCGYKWAFQVMKSMELSIRNVYASNDRSAVFELDSTYEFRTGQVIDQAQTFVIEMEGDKIIRLQAFTSHAPKGTEGFFLKILHLFRGCLKSKSRQSSTQPVSA